MPEVRIRYEHEYCGFFSIDDNIDDDYMTIKINATKDLIEKWRKTQKRFFEMQAQLEAVYNCEEQRIKENTTPK